MRTRAAGRCLVCNAKLRDEHLCLECGYPTRAATGDERIQWEIAQWDAHRMEKRDNRGPVRSIPASPEAWPTVAPAKPGPPLGSAGASETPPRRKKHGLRRTPQPVGIEIDLRTTEPAVVFPVHAGRRPARLVLDRAVVFMEPSGPGRRRWIPIEEVSSVRVTERLLVLEGTVERIRVRCRDSRLIEQAGLLITEAVNEGRRGLRHDPDVVQAWCELTSDLWKAPLGRAKIRARKIGPLL